MAERYTPDDIDTYLQRLMDADNTQIAALRRANWKAGFREREFERQLLTRFESIHSRSTDEYDFEFEWDGLSLDDEAASRLRNAGVDEEEFFRYFAYPDVFSAHPEDYKYYSSLAFISQNAEGKLTDYRETISSLKEGNCTFVTEGLRNLCKEINENISVWAVNLPEDIDAQQAAKHSLLLTEGARINGVAKNVSGNAAVSEVATPIIYALQDNDELSSIEITKERGGPHETLQAENGQEIDSSIIDTAYAFHRIETTSGAYVRFGEPDIEVYDEAGQRTAGGEIKGRIDDSNWKESWGTTIEDKLSSLDDDTHTLLLQYIYTNKTVYGSDEDDPESYAISEMIDNGTLDMPFSLTLIDTNEDYRAEYTDHIRALLGF
jgi:hypothetical protein